jgi:hypothetical protein
MPRTIQPGPREIELRARAVYETQNLHVELHGLFEFASRHIVMVEHTNAHFHRASPQAFAFEYTATCYMGGGARRAMRSVPALF